MEQVYAFHAVTPDGAFTRGTVDAECVSDARDIVVGRGMFVLAIEAKGARRERREPLSAADLALGLRILADLLESGLPVTRALHTFQDLAPRGWRNALPHIRQSVREGKSLAAALSAAPLEIPALVIGIAQAGEAGTGIGPAVRRAADLTEATADMQSALRSALAYPAVVALAGVLAITVLITVVLPRFAKILADLGQKLPASTQFVLHIADLAHTAFLPSLIAGGILFAAWRSWSQTESGRVQWHRTLLGVPVVGSVRQGAATARMAHSLSALLESGVPIATAIMFAARAAGDSELQRRLSNARTNIVAGQTLSQALDANAAASQTTIKLIRAGEESGRLAGMLSHAAKIEQKRVDQIVKTLVRMLEPGLLLTFASVVALVAAALLQAIYSVRPTA
ncbi:MAG TPA: type II secretion system F family protein [Gemmatimonadaceae bacterium]|nr:type II secretion system F family protein [Gemmatimonadaceae bacterium]